MDVNYESVLKCNEKVRFRFAMRSVSFVFLTGIKRDLREKRNDNDEIFLSGSEYFFATASRFKYSMNLAAVRHSLFQRRLSCYNYTLALVVNPLSVRYKTD